MGLRASMLVERIPETADEQEGVSSHGGEGHVVVWVSGICPHP